MESAVRLQNSFLKHHYYPHLLIVLVVCLLSGEFMSFCNLDWSQAAKVLEMYVGFTGIILLTPLFLPEQDKEIWLLEQSKQRSMWKLYLQRGITAAAVLVLVVSGFVWLLKFKNPQLDARSLWLGGFSEIMFLGSLGFFVSALTNQAVLGYMLSIMFYAVNIGASKVFGPFALFQMMKGKTDFWPYMLAGSAFLMFFGIITREKISRRNN